MASARTEMKWCPVDRKDRSELLFRHVNEIDAR